MRKIGVILLWLLVGTAYSYAQSKSCQHNLTIIVQDAIDGNPIENVNITIDHSRRFSSDAEGSIKLDTLCSNNYIFTLQHTAYKTIQESIKIFKDSLINIFMYPVSKQIKEVEVLINTNLRNTQNQQHLASTQRLESLGNSLSEVLTDIAGINTLKTGTTIGKPILNGLYGSRLLLINNGIKHESQQWGMDHAPEIDPFMGQDISVIKSSDAVRYGPDALAGIILVNPAPIKTDRLIYGTINLIGQSNGRSTVINTKLEGGIGHLAYRTGVTTKMAGNIKTANYYLGNTGTRELNFNTQISYTIKRSNLELSWSRFGTDIGIFTGAHIGNKDDIMARIAYGEPFENYNFSYNIAAPKQQVVHDLAKASWSFKMSPSIDLETTYSFQKNHRQEYDLRRVQDDDVPMADMVLTTQAVEMLMHTDHTTVGLSGYLQVNNNIPGTGTTPFIPNFDNHSIGIFASQKAQFHKTILEFGVRYDYKYFDAAGYRYDYTNPNTDGSLNQFLLTDRKHFNNLSGTMGLMIPFAKYWYWKSNLGLAWRAPSANELYSDGIHHGTGTYEVGNKDLKSERGLKWINTFNVNKSWFNANLDVFGQSISNYIYADPDPDSVRQTIRGTFPLFQHKQTNALLYGTDIALGFDIHTNWQYTLNYAIVVGKNRNKDTYLPFIPSNRCQHSLRYQVMKNAYLKLNHLYVSKQTNYEKGTDYAPPPPSYHLFSCIAAYTFKWQQPLHVQLGMENIFNSAYKDYMDRFRYYAHQQGRNVTVKLNYKF